MTLSSQITAQMERCIEQGDWAVGSKIPSEMELVTTFSVSRNTVRESILALVYAGVLQSIPGDGTYVVQDGQFSAVMQKRVQLARQSDILETRMILETNIARLACERSADKDLILLKNKKEQRENPSLGNQEFIKANQAFHMQIASQCHNSLLYDLYVSFLAVFETELLTAYMNNPQADRQHRLHNDLHTAILKKDCPHAIETMTAIMPQEKKLLQQDT